MVKPETSLLDPFLNKTKLVHISFYITYVDMLVSIVLMFSWTSEDCQVVLFDMVKIPRFLVLEVLYFLCHWKHYVQMGLENLSVFLIGKALQP